MENPNIGGLVDDAARTLAAAGVDTPRFDAKLLLAHAAGVEPRDVDRAVLMGEPLAFDAARFHAMVVRRAGREPLQYIVGHAPFRYLDVEVGPGVFIPRPETETVVQVGLDWLAAHHRGGRPRVVDLCAGSGVIGLSVVTEVPDAEVWAVELSEAAHTWTERNRRLVTAGHPDVADRYHLLLGDATSPGILAELDGTVDLVISNPPYVPETDVPEQPEVRDHDPESALYGGSPDGLCIPERIIGRAAGLLRPGGALVMEHDISQGAALRSYAAAHGFGDVATGDDLTGRPRYLFGVYLA